MSTSSNELLGEMIINLCEWSIISYYVIYLSIATYHVQDFTISNNSDINITCIFAIGSNATGCLVILTSDYYQWNITIYKDGGSTSTTTTVPVDGSYIVTVHDVVDGVISNEPAITHSEVLFLYAPSQVMNTTTTDVTGKGVRPPQYTTIIVSFTQMYPPAS